MPVVNLPNKDGRLKSYRLAEPRSWKHGAGQEFRHVVLAAAHLVADTIGIVRLACLNGHQSRFASVRVPDLTVSRFGGVLRVHGVAV
jgi:hypothetical protein